MVTRELHIVKYSNEHLTNLRPGENMGEARDWENDDDHVGLETETGPFEMIRALVVDPQRDPAQYLRAAAGGGLRLGFSAATQLHAAFVSGSRELAAQRAQVLAVVVGGPADWASASGRALETGR